MVRDKKGTYKGEEKRKFYIQSIKSAKKINLYSGKTGQEGWYVD